MTYLMSSHERRGRGLCYVRVIGGKTRLQGFSSHGGKAEVCSVMGYDAT